jgi:hypothetical protein
MNRLKMNNLKQEAYIPLYSKTSGLTQRLPHPPIKVILVAFYSKIQQLGRVTENHVYLWPNIRMRGALPTASAMPSCYGMEFS